MPAQPKAAPAAQLKPEAPYPAPRYAWYVVAVLTLVYVFAFIDRQILALLVGPVRRDLHISDTQLSVLMGFGFAVFYTSFGIPLGRLADVRSRRTIIALGFALWSAFTAACGLARNFWQMLPLRMGVGVGEAALSPAAYSMITDYFPKERLATAISVYSMGIYIGSGLAYLLGGIVVRFASTKEAWLVPLLGEVRPWQAIFLVVGMPGVLLALLMYTVREPLRRGLIATRPSVPMAQAFAYMLKNKRTFLCHNIGFGLLSLASYASGAWIPAYYQRVFHVEISKVGMVYGTIVVIFGSAGIVGAGRVADMLRERGRRNANLLVGMWAALLALPVHFLFCLAPTSQWATLWLAPATMLAAAPFGVSAAAIQQMMPNEMRGQASAVYLFILNMIGLGLGPTAVALCTQYLFGRDEAVNYSLLIVTVTATCGGAALLASGLKPYLRSLDYLKEWVAAR
jgi:MFS family permease